MRRILLAALAVMPLAPSYADEASPLIVKSYYSGYTHPDWVRNERCELFADKVVITRSFGRDVKTIETHAIEIQGDVAKLIAEAAKANKKETPNYLCDGPSTVIEAFSPTADEEGIALYSTGGCGSPSVSREGAAAENLRAMIGVYCPKTVEAPGA